jgi:hypothetical protein
MKRVMQESNLEGNLLMELIPTLSKSKTKKEVNTIIFIQKSFALF